MRFSLPQFQRFFIQKIIFLLLLCFCAGIFSACSTIGGVFHPAPKPTCPKIAVLSAREKTTHNGITGQIVGLSYSCNEMDKTLQMDLDIGFVAERKLIKDATQIELPYFVSYVLADDTIVQKKIFPLTIAIKKNEPAALQKEQLHLSFPYDKDTMTDAQVIVGFQN